MFVYTHFGNCIVDQVVDLLRNMDPESPERFPFLNGAIRWTMKVETEHKAGHPTLHQKCGMLFWQGNTERISMFPKEIGRLPWLNGLSQISNYLISERCIFKLCKGRMWKNLDLLAETFGFPLRSLDIAFQNE